MAYDDPVERTGTAAVADTHLAVRPGTDGALLLALSLFHAYTAGFGLLPETTHRGIHMAFVIGLIFLVFPVRHGTMVNYVGFVPTDEEMKESWSAPGDPAVLRREFAGWDPRIDQVLAQVLGRLATAVHGDHDEPRRVGGVR